MRVLIADDEAPARQKVRRLLADEPDVEIVAEAATGAEAVQAIRDAAPDVVFLDVQMPVLDGFGVVEEVGVDAMPHVVFVTAYDEHALRAFEVRALDYLLKPVTPDRFRLVLQRVRAQLARGGDVRHDLAERLDQLVGALAPKPRFLRRLLVQDGNKALLLPVERIERMEAERNYVRLHAGGGTYVVRGSIGAMADRLDPDRFLRINRSEIVRLDAVKELHPWFHGDYRVVMHDGTVLTWSRRYRALRDGEFGGAG
jgi:two-component system, LytTR family, response regulator